MKMNIEVDLKNRMVIVDHGTSRIMLNLPPSTKRYELVMYGPRAWETGQYRNPIWATEFLQALSDCFFFAVDFEDADDSIKFWGGDTVGRR
jgi:hypothetical protein